MNRHNNAAAAISVGMELQGRVALESASTQSKTRKVDDAYRRYCDILDAGDYVDPDDYCASFPSFQSSLGKLLKAHCYLEAHPELLEEHDTPWPAVGETFLGFQLVHQLGKGAFARVFLAKQNALGDRLVVVKISRHGGAAEAKTLGRIQHPNVVPIHSIHHDAATAQTLVCMPYLGAATLHDVFDRLNVTTVRKANAQVFQEASTDFDKDELPLVDRPSSAPVTKRGNYVDALRRVAWKLADALAFIHRHGVCHLDLKPSNVLVSPRGEPLLLDFNLSSDAQRDRLVQGGTLPYMSPEQLSYFLGHGEKATVGPGSDLFSFGVLFYELATGTHPFGPIPIKEPNESLAKVLLERQQRGFEPVRKLNPEIDAEFARLIESCLRHSPKARLASAADLASMLKQQSQPLARTRRWMVRNPIKLCACVLLGVMTMVAAVAPFATRRPENEVLFAAALEYYREGKHLEAIKQFNRVIENDPGNDGAFFARGRAFQKLGAEDRTYYTLAVQDYSQAQKLAPNGRNDAALGYCCLLMPKPSLESAINRFEAAEKAGFINSALLNNLAFCYDRTGRPVEALQYYDRAILSEPVCQAAYHNRALFNLNAANTNARNLEFMAKKQAPEQLRKAFDDAMRTAGSDFVEALKMGPLSSDLLYFSACFHATASRTDAKAKGIAIAQLELAIREHNYQLDPNDQNLVALRSEKAFQGLLLLPRPTPPQTRAVRYPDPVSD